MTWTALIHPIRRVISFIMKFFNKRIIYKDEAPRNCILSLEVLKTDMAYLRQIYQTRDVFCFFFRRISFSVGIPKKLCFMIIRAFIYGSRLGEVQYYVNILLIFVYFT